MALPTASNGLVTTAIRDGFLVLPENRSALRAAGRLARFLLEPGRRRKPLPPLFLHGPSGTGKSHLANRVVAEVIDGTADRTVQVIPAVDLGRLLMEPPGEGDRRQELRACDLLVVEDVQHFPAGAADDFACLIDHRQARSRCLLATASAGPAALRQLPRRLSSRLAAGVVVALEPLAEPSRRALAAEVCEQRRLRVTDEVLGWLAREPGAARPILGAITRLEALARTVPQPLTLAAVLADLPAEPAPESALERIGRRVAEWFGMSLRQVRGPARHRAVLWPRQVGMFLARRLTGLPLVQIGAFFGGRDHSTVLHACQKVDDQRAGDPALARALRQLEAELG